MKFAIFLTVALVATTPALAGTYQDAAAKIRESGKYDNDRPISEMEKADKCTYSASMAEMIMEARQAGVAMGSMITVANGNPAITGLVSLAYDETQWHGDDARNRAVREFADQFYKVCFDDKEG